MVVVVVADVVVPVAVVPVAVVEVVVVDNVVSSHESHISLHASRISKPISGSLHFSGPGIIHHGGSYFPLQFSGVVVVRVVTVCDVVVAVSEVVVFVVVEAVVELSVIVVPVPVVVVSVVVVKVVVVVVRLVVVEDEVMLVVVVEVVSVDVVQSHESHIIGHSLVTMSTTSLSGKSQNVELKAVHDKGSGLPLHVGSN